jgi:hypothetical protein
VSHRGLRFKTLNRPSKPFGWGHALASATAFARGASVFLFEGFVKAWRDDTSSRRDFPLDSCQ